MNSLMSGSRGSSDSLTRILRVDRVRPNRWLPNKLSTFVLFFLKSGIYPSVGCVGNREFLALDWSDFNQASQMGEFQVRPCNYSVSE
jgi:hypothetical protein